MANGNHDPLLLENFSREDLIEFCFGTTQRRIPLEQQYGYERGLSRAVSSDASARASRSASAMEPLPRGNQAMPAARTRARKTMAVARLNRIPSMKSLSATARIALCVLALRCLIGRPGPISAE